MSRRIATLWDDKGNDDCNNEDHESGQAFYAGGSEHSGQQIIGPSAAESFFERTRQSSALLDEQSPSANTLPVVFWRNGFTIGNDTELREYDSNQNRDFLESLRRGETPPELAHRAQGGVIDVKLEYKVHTDYKPETQQQIFAGEGHRLGCVVPQTIQSQSQESSSRNSQPDSNNSCLEVNETEPTTSIQVRLADNTRLTIRANLTHSIQQIIDHIRSVRPQYSDGNFVLATTYPAKELNDLNQTINEANLKNALVLQRLKP